MANDTAQDICADQEMLPETFANQSVSPNDFVNQTEVFDPIQTIFDSLFDNPDCLDDDSFGCQVRYISVEIVRDG